MRQEVLPQREKFHLSFSLNWVIILSGSALRIRVWELGSHFLFHGTSQYMGAYTHGHCLARLWGPVNSCPSLELQDQCTSLKGIPKPLLNMVVWVTEFSQTTVWKLPLNIVSIVSPCIGGCEIGREKLKSLKFIYL